MKKNRTEVNELHNEQSHRCFRSLLFNFILASCLASKISKFDFFLFNLCLQKSEMKEKKNKNLLSSTAFFLVAVVVVEGTIQTTCLVYRLVCV